MPRLLTDIEPRKNDDSLRRFLEGVVISETRQLRSQDNTSTPAVADPAISPAVLAPGSSIETPSLTNSPKKDHQSSSSDSETPITPPDTRQPQATPSAKPSTAPMASQRSRLGRSNARGGSQDISAQTIWNDFNRDHLSVIKELEAKSKALGDKIIELEAKIKRDKESPAGVSITDLDALSGYFREQLRITDEIAAKVKNEGITTTIQMMIDMKRQEEQAAAEKARASSSRPGLDFDGPSDSPVPSPADNRQIKKLGTSRTGSQPPNRPEGTPSEASERTGKPKIVYAQHEEVAFKRKTAAKPEEQDWILGKVSRVIGEGKSRRYEVEDPFPDTNSAGPVMYKSSASQMVPIPAEGTFLEDYEIGRRVLALYPDTTTFYRAEVKAMLDGGANVQLLFEDEAAGELKVVTRRFVLDHKG